MKIPCSLSSRLVLKSFKAFVSYVFYFDTYFKLEVFEVLNLSINIKCVCVLLLPLHVFKLTFDKRSTKILVIHVINSSHAVAYGGL